MTDVVYCDRLSPWTCVSLARAVRRTAPPGLREVRVLDPIPAGWRGALARRALEAFGFTATEEPFYAGHLRLPDGMPAQRQAATSTMISALPESARIVSSSHRLTSLNTEWGRETVRLHLAKGIAMTFGVETSLYGTALRVQVARALAAREGRSARLLIQRPALFGEQCLQQLAPEIAVSTYGSAAALLAAKRQALKQAARGAVRAVRGALSWARNAPRLAEMRRSAQQRPGLLVLQEDDLGLDRSYRSQPHWLLPEDPLPDFSTYVLAQGRAPRASADRDALAAAHVHPLSDDDLLGLSAAASPDATLRETRRTARRCSVASLFSGSIEETTSLALLARLFWTAGELTAACRELRVRAFMTAENYLVAPDAMALICERLGVRTLSYQFSSLAVPSPPMMTTMDVMFTFASRYRQHWQRDGIAPRAFVDLGYPFDDAFARVRGRAAATRQRLRDAGATCVIAYFDENFFRGTKYGLTTYEEHCDELRALLECVLRDSTIAVITKVQFERNSASRLPELQGLAREAAATGRFVELLRGVHRNTIFPAEAALAADVTIGHAIGSTASLEAALAGTRSLMLNPYVMRDANHPLYERADILVPSLAEALDAVRQFRAGTRPALGDWSAILPQLDPYRDGGTARRLRVALDATLAGADLRDEQVQRALFGVQAKRQVS